MNHDTRITRQNNLPVQADDPWSAAPTVMVADSPQNASAFAKAHRLLRGRYALVIPLAILFAIGGAIGGYFSQEPQYRSDGLIYISPIQESWIEGDRPMTAHQPFVDHQIALLQGHRLLQMAFNSPEWQRFGRGEDPVARARFSENVRVRRMGTSHIVVSFTDSDHRAAQVAVHQIMDAYERFEHETAARDIKERIERNEQRRDELMGQRARADEALKGHARATEYGTDNIDIILNSRVQKLEQLRMQLYQASLHRQAAEVALGVQGEELPETDISTLTVHEIAAVDNQMQGYLGQRRHYEFQLRQVEQRQGQASPAYRNAKLTLDLHEQLIEEYAEEFRQNYAAAIMARTNTDTLTPATVTARRAEERRLAELFNAETTAARALSERSFEFRELRTEIEQIDRELAETRQRLTRLHAMDDMTNPIMIVDRGTEPYTPALDRRKQMAAVGFVGGGAFPVALLLLIGLLDHRFRYSDETESDGRGITLLGILPNLPDRLSDPEQAAIAAHCVHQIRTMLQINRPGEDRRVYGITSATPGDGKTSLTLALGLSFAASGSRTLLIDCDLVGGGLTARLNLLGPDGVLEAMANDALLEYVRTTDVPDLAVLPVGAAHAHHASAVSPRGLKRMLDEARRHFDVVIVDTGPILGSIEASPVASTVDGIVLTVARGQQRPLVEKAIQRLTVIGANLAGMVFNRAQASDFHPSINRMSIGALARPVENGHKTPRRPRGAPEQVKSYGPVARAVATDVTDER